MYKTLAEYYDLLVGDEEATLLWVDFVKRHAIGSSILELACGSGAITAKLNDRGYSIMASDISDQMINIAKAKFPNINFFVMDMLDITVKDKVDIVCCFCDSVNYLSDINEVETLIKQVSNILNEKGRFLFDIHSIDRIAEFKEPFIEEGYLGDTPYQWSIVGEENKLYHHFVFWQQDNIVEEYHTQTIFDLTEVLKLLHKYNFTTDVYTDFDYHGVKDGERYCIVAKKGEIR